MSSSQSYYSSSSMSYSSINGQTTGHEHSQHTTSDASGTTISTSSQDLGKEAKHESRRFDAQGRELLGGGSSDNRITDAEQAERDRQYEERMEEEYAKREGGA